MSAVCRGRRAFELPTASAGFGVEGLCCYILTGVDGGHAAIAVLAIGIGMSGFTVSGWQINHLDLAPKYASVLVGISATIGTLGGIVSPIVVGVMTHPQVPPGLRER